MGDTISILRTEGICKQFNGVQVLNNVNLEIKKGEIHALLGENGAGKSTIIKIITGVYTRDAGIIYVDGQPAKINNRHDARKYGISVIYQELSLVPALTVTENIYLGQEIMKHGLPDLRTMRCRVLELIKEYGFQLDPDAVVESMGMAQRQMTEILKALSVDAKLIIMDEPTSSLSASETEKLFLTMENLRQMGKSILYISHRMEEIFRIANRMTVMRNGEIIGVIPCCDSNPNDITSMMIGRELRDEKQRVPNINYDHCLSVEHLSYENILHDISFKAYGGEILGIGGLVGSGRTEIISCIYGYIKKYSGSITLNGKPISKKIVINIRNGFGFVPEDRRNEGLFSGLSVGKNLTISSYDLLSKFGIVNSRREQSHAEKAIGDYNIRPAKRTIPAANLSGGNQQKVVLGRWLSRDLKVLLLDEPTVGVDVGVKADLYRFMRQLADEGAIIIMVSSDIAELVNVSDRVLIIRKGQLFKEFPDQTATQQGVLLASSGVDAKEGVNL